MILGEGFYLQLLLDEVDVGWFDNYERGGFIDTKDRNFVPITHLIKSHLKRFIHQLHALRSQQDERFILNYNIYA